MVEKIFPATDESYPQACEFIESELEAAGCGMKAMMQISVAFEEMYINIVHYAYPEGNGEAKVEISTDDNKAVIRLYDSGIPYNPLAREDPDITLSVEERGVGGLGIYMVKKSMDEVAYEYTNGQNIFTMVKNF